MADDSDPDLPGNADFAPLPPVVDKVLPVRCADCPTTGRCPTCGGPHGVIGMAMTISPKAQADIHHNRLRYAELAALRLGLPNSYAKTRYRH